MPKYVKNSEVYNLKFNTGTFWLCQEMILSSSEFTRPKVGILFLYSVNSLLGASSENFGVVNFTVCMYILCVMCDK